MLDHFIPSEPMPRLPLLGDLLPRLPLSVAHAAIQDGTRPGGVVIDPFCVGASVIRAAVESDRKVIAASFNPIAIRAVESALWPVDARSALTHLADARKGDQRLRDHVLALYTTRCPTCGASATAQSFAWARDSNTPIYKIVACPTCGPNSGKADADDAASARKHEPRGLPFWLLHSKVVPRDHEDAYRVSEALDAYTPRALNAIADILLRFEGLSPADRTALQAPLIGLFDAASSLHPADETGQPIYPRSRPRSFRLPARFVEHNVWLALEALTPDPSPSQGEARHEGILRAADIETLLSMREPAVCLLVESSRDLARRLPPESIDLLLARPPLPDPTLWTLSAVWTAWLWGKSGALNLLPILSQRRTNWDWQWRAIATALDALRPALGEDAHAFLTFNADDAPGESALDGVALAIAAASLSPVRVLCDPFDGYQIQTRPEASRPGDRDREALAQDIGHVAIEAAVKTLRARGEPSSWPTLHASILEALAEDGALAVTARLPEDGPQPLSLVRESMGTALKSTGGPVAALDDRTWWLADAARAAEPLADRVERAALQVIRSEAEWDEPGLLREIYRCFPGDLSPERPLVAACIASYTEEASGGRVRLRTEDQVERRAAEVQSMQRDLSQLGVQLGYTVESHAGGIAWKDSGATAYTLVISATAEMGAMLRYRRMLAGTPVLVIPGSRATLFQHKLARDVRLHEAVEHGAWQFLKFSAARELMAHPHMDRRTFTLALGLDPPLEQPQAQIPLL